jgi:hypothetical protein
MAEETKQHNENCGTPAHEEHLCYLMYQGYHYENREKYKELVQGAEFICTNCGRTAKDQKNLCAPSKL